MSQATSTGFSRRDVLKLGALAGATASLAPLATSPLAAVAAATAPSDFNEMTITQFQALIGSGQMRSTDLVNFYLRRIQALDQGGPLVNSYIEINPDSQAIAQQLDTERQAGHVRGPLHGVPVLLKDNVDTHDRMQSAAGSLALVGTPPAHDATVAANLRAAGAVILGKTTLSEWANFRSFYSTSGWSGRGGQCNNPYAIDRNPCGSSSGSGAAAAANFTAVSIGTETDGSIVCPANHHAVVGIKPTVGLVSRAGIVPISHTQDTAGPHTRTMADGAAVLTAIAQRTADPRDPATSGNRNRIPRDYTQFLNADGLRGARIGVARDFEGSSPHTDSVFEDALTAMRNAGATLVDVFFPHISDINSGTAEFTVLLYDFKVDLNNYLSQRVGCQSELSRMRSTSTMRTPTAKCRSSARRFSSWPSRSTSPTRTRFSRWASPTTRPWHRTRSSAPARGSTCCFARTACKGSWPRRTPRPGRPTSSTATISSLAAHRRRRSSATPSLMSRWDSPSAPRSGSRSWERHSASRP